jgi:hypothetical protein
MQDSYKQIKIDPPLPCVCHDCDRQAHFAIAYEVSEREWRIVPTCERHTVPVPTQNGKVANGARR